jgi:hypothetical protein
MKQVQLCHGIDFSFTDSLDIFKGHIVALFFKFVLCIIDLLDFTE